VIPSGVQAEGGKALIRGAPFVPLSVALAACIAENRKINEMDPAYD